MKKYLFLFISFSCFLFNSIVAQVKVYPSSQMEISTQIPAWESALRCKVPLSDTYSYNLYNNNLGRDVSFFHASGYLWTLRGGYFGSDENFKRNISLIDNPLGIIKTLRGLRFQFIPQSAEEDSLYSKEPGGGYRFGLIAQEVEQVIPEVVKTLPDGTLAVSYTDIIAILIESIKMQQSQIEDMRRILIEHNMISE